jgi:hypothetical protein
MIANRQNSESYNSQPMQLGLQLNQSFQFRNGMVEGILFYNDTAIEKNGLIHVLEPTDMSKLKFIPIGETEEVTEPSFRWKHKEFHDMTLEMLRVAVTHGIINKEELNFEPKNEVRDLVLVTKKSNEMLERDNEFLREKLDEAHELNSRLLTELIKANVSSTLLTMLQNKQSQ